MVQKYWNQQDSSYHHQHLETVVSDGAVHHERCARELVLLEQHVAVGIGLPCGQERRDTVARREAGSQRMRLVEDGELLRPARVAEDGAVERRATRGEIGLDEEVELLLAARRFLDAQHIWIDRLDQRGELGGRFLRRVGLALARQLERRERPPPRRRS